jgi:hypothetical protein
MSYGWDLVTVAGLGLISWGLGLVYWPLSPIFIGGVLITVGIRGALTEALPTVPARQEQPTSSTLPPHAKG